MRAGQTESARTRGRANNFEIGKSGLPKLLLRRRRALDRIGNFNDNEGQAGDEILNLEEPLNRGLRH